MLFLYPHSALSVLPAVNLGTGVLVWVFGRGFMHLAASGLADGLVSYVCVAGLLHGDRRYRRFAAGGAHVRLAGLRRGTDPAGRVPGKTLLAALISVLFALALRQLDIPPRRRYVGGEDHASDDDDEEMAVADRDDDSAPR